MEETHYPVRHRNREVITVGGRFKPNGSSPITNTQGTTVFGRGWTVAYTSSGLYTVTLSKAYTHLLNVNVSLQLAAQAALLTVQVASHAVTTATGGTIAFTTLIADKTATDVEANAGNWIHWEAKLLSVGSLTA